MGNIGRVAIACLNNISPVSSTVLVYACGVVLAILRDIRCIIIAGLRNGRCVRISWRLCPLGDGCLVIVSQILRHRGGAVAVAGVVVVVLADGCSAIGPILRDGGNVHVCIAIGTALDDGRLISPPPPVLGHRGCLVVAVLAYVRRTRIAILHSSR